jgi:hypothetical protein
MVTPSYATTAGACAAIAAPTATPAPAAVLPLLLLLPLLLVPLLVVMLPLPLQLFTHSQSHLIGLVPGSGLGFVLCAGCQTSVEEGQVPLGAHDHAFMRGWWKVGKGGE